MVEEVKKYKDFVENAIKEINNKYNTVVFTTIDEIIKGEMDTNSIWWSLSKINDSSYKRRKVIEKKLNSLSEEDYDNWGYELQDEVDSLHSSLDWKVMTLQGLLDNLKIFDDDDVKKYFKDVKSIEL